MNIQRELSGQIIMMVFVVLLNSILIINQLLYLKAQILIIIGFEVVSIGMIGVWMIKKSFDMSFSSKIIRIILLDIYAIYIANPYIKSEVKRIISSCESEVFYICLFAFFALMYYSMKKRNIIATIIYRFIPFVASRIVFHSNENDVKLDIKIFILYIIVVFFISVFCFFYYTNSFRMMDDSDITSIILYEMTMSFLLFLISSYYWIHPEELNWNRFLLYFKWIYSGVLIIGGMLVMAVCLILLMVSVRRKRVFCIFKESDGEEQREIINDINNKQNGFAYDSMMVIEIFYVFIMLNIMKKYYFTGNIVLFVLFIYVAQKTIKNVNFDNLTSEMLRITMQFMGMNISCMLISRGFIIAAVCLSILAILFSREYNRIKIYLDDENDINEGYRDRTDIVMDILIKLFSNIYNQISIVLGSVLITFTLLCNIKCSYYFNYKGFGIPQKRAIVVLCLILGISVFGLLVFKPIKAIRGDIFVKYRVVIIVISILSQCFLVAKESNNISLSIDDRVLKITVDDSTDVRLSISNGLMFEDSYIELSDALKQNEKYHTFEVNNVFATDKYTVLAFNDGNVEMKTVFYPNTLKGLFSD